MGNPVLSSKKGNEGDAHCTVVYNMHCLCYKVIYQECVLARLYLANVETL